MGAPARPGFGRRLAAPSLCVRLASALRDEHVIQYLNEREGNNMVCVAFRLMHLCCRQVSLEIVCHHIRLAAYDFPIECPMRRSAKDTSILRKFRQFLRASLETIMPANSAQGHFIHCLILEFVRHPHGDRHFAGAGALEGERVVQLERIRQPAHRRREQPFAAVY